VKAHLSRSEHRIEAERKLQLAIEQSRHQAEPNSWTIPYLLMAQVHATLSLEATDYPMEG